MSDHNTTFTAATSSDSDGDGDSNIDANKTSGGGYDYVDGPRKSNDRVSGNDASMLMNSFGEKFDNDGKNNKTQSSSMRTIDEEKSSEIDDPCCEEEIMAMMDDYSGVADKGSTNNDTTININGNFGVSYSADTVMMDSNSIGNSARHHYGNNNNNNNNNNKDCGNATAASQIATGNGDDHHPSHSRGSFLGHGHGHGHGHGNGGLRIDASSSSSGEVTAPSWFAAVKDAATKPSTPTINNLTNDNGGRHQEENRFEKEGHQESEQRQQQQQQQEETSESTEMMQDISAKLNDKLNNTRLLAKRLLQEMTVYVQSLETVANEYGRIRESELRESQRLDAVEPEVNGASGMLLASAAGPGASTGVGVGVGNGDGDGGEGFFVASDTGARQPSPPLVGQGLGHRYKRHCHASPKQQQQQQQQQQHQHALPTTRPLTPVVGNRRSSDNGLVGGTGKENYDSLRRSFA
jgi:hypothetical protein